MMDVRKRVEDRVATWQILVERSVETDSSVLAFGRQRNRPVVLKVIKRDGDEWRCGEILDAFGGCGTVRVYAYVDGAILMERLQPGLTLAHVAVNGSDEEATGVLADVISQMAPDEPPRPIPAVQDWAKGFDRYAATGDHRIPAQLVVEARHMFRTLCHSQSRVRLLHGDLHHYNVLSDTDRGWVAVDPKGVMGELEYEIGAALRNPLERPAMLVEPARIEKRVERFSRTLRLNPERVLAWSFAQAVLSAVWTIEDGFALEHDDPSLALALAIRPMLNGLLDR